MSTTTLKPADPQSQPEADEYTCEHCATRVEWKTDLSIYDGLLLCDDCREMMNGCRHNYISQVDGRCVWCGASPTVRAAQDLIESNEDLPQ